MIILTAAAAKPKIKIVKNKNGGSTKATLPICRGQSIHKHHDGLAVTQHVVQQRMKLELSNTSHRHTLTARKLGSLDKISYQSIKYKETNENMNICCATETNSDPKFRNDL